MPRGTNTVRGSNTTIFVANTPAAVKVGSGFLHRIIITATLTGSITVNDNAAAAAGPLLFTSAAAPAVGTIIEVNVPFTLGAWLVPGTAGTCVAVYD